MKKLIAAAFGAALVMGVAAPVAVAEAQARCAACNSRPTEVRVSHRVVNHQRVVNRYRVIPRTRVVNHNRVILHKRIVLNRYHTVYRDHVHYRNIVLHRHNTAHRYAVEQRAVRTASRRVSVSQSTVHRHVRGTTCNCGAPRYASSAPRMKRNLVHARY
jgi:hypothetical protein